MRTPGRFKRYVVRDLGVLALGVGIAGGRADGASSTLVEDELGSIFDSNEPEEERCLSDGAQRAIERLASHPDRGARGAFLDRVGVVMSRLSPLDRTRLVAEWATSPRRELRLAAARSLQTPFRALGVHSALDLLRADSDVAIRDEADAANVVRQLI